jgi:hypothetical protein
MRSWTVPQTLSKQRAIRQWKKRYLHKKPNTVEQTIFPSRRPVFTASTDSAEVAEFLRRMRKRD